MDSFSAGHIGADSRDRGVGVVNSSASESIGDPVVTRLQKMLAEADLAMKERAETDPGMEFMSFIEVELRSYLTGRGLA